MTILVHIAASPARVTRDNDDTDTAMAVKESPHPQISKEYDLQATNEYAPQATIVPPRHPPPLS